MSSTATAPVGGTAVSQRRASRRRRATRPGIAPHGRARARSAAAPSARRTMCRRLANVARVVLRAFPAQHRERPPVGPLGEVDHVPPGQPGDDGEPTGGQVEEAEPVPSPVLADRALGPDHRIVVLGPAPFVGVGQFVAGHDGHQSSVGQRKPARRCRRASAASLGRGLGLGLGLGPGPGLADRTGGARSGDVESPHRRRSTARPSPGTSAAAGPTRCRRSAGRRAKIVDRSARAIDRWPAGRPSPGDEVVQATQRPSGEIIGSAAWTPSTIRAAVRAPARSVARSPGHSAPADGRSKGFCMVAGERIGWLAEGGGGAAQGLAGVSPRTAMDGGANLRHCVGNLR